MRRAAVWFRDDLDDVRTRLSLSVEAELTCGLNQMTAARQSR
jgi:hypothetical protein